jgi:8-amino-7-oxononanoate synthase
LRKARLFTTALNLPPAESAIVPVVLGDPRRVMEASAALEKEGFLVAGIRPPTVPRGTARLRITFAAVHRDDDVRALAAAIRRMGLLRDAA